MNRKQSSNPMTEAAQYSFSDFPSYKEIPLGQYFDLIGNGLRFYTASGKYSDGVQ